jgi:hypothetical protein
MLLKHDLCLLCIMLICAIRFCYALCYIDLSILYYVVPCFATLHCTILHCASLYCATLNCTLLYLAVRYRANLIYPILY